FPDVRESFDDYRRLMTTKDGSPDDGSSLYFFWKERLDWTIEPLDGGNAFEKRLVSDTLVKLCVEFLFGNGSSIPFSQEVDLLATSLVMAKIEREIDWKASMAEPMVLCASVNYLADEAPAALTKFFSSQLFSPLTATPQERGHKMELFIALRFIQQWWEVPELKKFLPAWVNEMQIPKPLGVLDGRRSQNGGDSLFLEQLTNSQYPWVLLPAANAGPDLRFSAFCCYVKTTSTARSKSWMHVLPKECEANIETMNPSNWYRSQPSVHPACCELATKQSFVHMHFELPYTEPSKEVDFKCGEGEREGDYVICVDLESAFALEFFGSEFVNAYKKFVKSEIRKQ
ncbi:hypothetical protein HDU76_006721, partial [Blyttiomyces sp. JEL0837]